MSMTRQFIRFSAGSALCVALAVGGSAGWAGAAPARNEQDAAALHVPLSRPSKPGLRFKEKTTAEYTDTALSRSPEGVANRRSVKRVISFDVDQEVMAVTPGGLPKAYTIDVVRFSETKGKTVTQLFPRGTRILGGAHASGATFYRDGKPLPEAMQSLLADLFGVSDKDDKVTLDQVFGTDAPRRIGESWQINHAKAMEWFNSPDNPRRILGLSGESRLIRKATMGGVDCFQIGNAFSVRHTALANWRMDPNPAEVHFISSMVRTLPVDPSAMERGYTSFRRHRYVSPVEGSPPGHSNEVISEGHYETEILPLPPNPSPSPDFSLPHDKAGPGRLELEVEPDDLKENEAQDWGRADDPGMEPPFEEDPGEEGE